MKRCSRELRTQGIRVYVRDAVLRKGKKEEKKALRSKESGDRSGKQPFLLSDVVWAALSLVVGVFSAS